MSHNVHYTTKAWKNVYVVGSRPSTWSACEQRKMKRSLKDPILGPCQRHDYLGKEARTEPGLEIRGAEV